MLVKPGEFIPLSIQLSDEDATGFPQATLLDDTNTPLVGSPVALSHVSGGLYRNTLVQMPVTARVFAQFRIYQDGTYTVRHPIHSDTLLDVFERDTISEALASLALGSSGPSEQLGDITGFIEDSRLSLVGSLEDSGLLAGEITAQDTLIGLVTEVSGLVGNLFDAGELVGIIKDC